ncbi:NAD(P)/FAD-dependent oxidoreductase [Streptomyces sp. 7-21]|uniref:NAD(P)/FAD-dependent oxidoreductase n=1 Tax=Streptomyces sp. 7-21 TaxID=2802283 RepID=UPI00191FF4AC|nr:FAD-dependent oxidoreductase [Streptomyces sp. 7-21]MBL1067709.1 NAD(P)/FAD-dependent oxidoreductase [Streptomyces sp. 7-21]
MSPDKRVVIVGGGMAAARLTQQLGAAPAVTVTVIGEEPHPAYNRVLLAGVLAGQYPPEVITLPRPPAGTRWLGGTRAVRLDRAARRVVCGDGRTVPYDTLVLATGSSPVLPPLRGLLPPRGGDLPAGVHAFRTLDDCLALDRDVREGAREAVVIGGGLLGVSAARALARRGVRVVLAHQGEHLMERQLDAGASALLRAHLADLGVEVHTECRVRSLVTAPEPGGSGRRATGVRLADGYALTAQLIVLACGVRPRAGLAADAGLALGTHGGIAVDGALRTSDPHVHAVGDCAEHDGVVYGLAGAAHDQADVLARVLAGTGAADGGRYAGTRALVRLTLGGTAPAAVLDLAAFGQTTPGPGDDVVHLADATRRAYRKIVVRGDRLRGGILLGDLGSVGTLARTWESDEPLPASAPLLHLLTPDAHHGGM